jgi:hypothetical protein
LESQYLNPLNRCSRFARIVHMLLQNNHPRWLWGLEL